MNLPGIADVLSMLSCWMEQYGWARLVPLSEGQNSTIISEIYFAVHIARKLKTHIYIKWFGIFRNCSVNDMQTACKRDVFIFKALLQNVPENEAHSQNVQQAKDLPRAGVKNICLSEGEMRHALLLVVAVVHFLSHSPSCHFLSQTEAFLKSRVWQRLKIDVQRHTYRYYCTFHIIHNVKETMKQLAEL